MPSGKVNAGKKNGDYSLYKPRFRTKTILNRGNCATSVLSKPYFHDEKAAFEYLESVLWADGIVCPHCGLVGGRVYSLEGVHGKASGKSPEGAIRHGLKKCGECREQFTVKVGTVFEHGRMPLFKMLQATYLMTCSNKGISAHQLRHTLEISYKAAWFLLHRIREAMRSSNLAPFGGAGGIVQVDETSIGLPLMRKTAFQDAASGSVD